MALISKIKGTDNIEYNVRDDVSVWGGRNLIKNTHDFYGWYKPSNGIFADGVFTFPAVSSKSWVVLASPSLPAEDYAGKDLTVSFDVRSDDADALNAESGYPAIQLMCKASSGGPQATTYSTRTHSKTGYNGNVTTSWQRISFTFPAVDYSTWTKHSDNTDAWLCINVWLYQVSSVQFRRFKVEVGNKPTDWSPAPEDIAHVNGECLELLS